MSAVKSNHGCMNCLRPGHFVRQCRSNTRRKFQKPLHTLLHVEPLLEGPTAPFPSLNLSSNASPTTILSGLVGYCREDQMVREDQIVPPSNLELYSIQHHPHHSCPSIWHRVYVFPNLIEMQPVMVSVAGLLQDSHAHPFTNLVVLPCRIPPRRSV